MLFRGTLFVGLLIVASAAWAAENRIERPDDDSMAKAAGQIKELFGADIAAAKTASQKTALAVRMIEVSNGCKNDEPSRLTLLLEARRLAVAAGNKQLAIQIAEMIVSRYLPDESLTTAEWLARGDKAFKEAGRRGADKRLAGQIDAAECYLQAKRDGKGVVAVLAQKKIENIAREAGDERSKKSPTNGRASHGRNNAVQNDVIVEGQGWRSFRIGATREELLKTYGKPNEDPASRYLHWRIQYHVGCAIDDEQGAYEIRFDPGFTGRLANGLALGSPEQSVLDFYGQPDNTMERPNGAKRYEYSAKGIEFWIYHGRVTQIIAIRPR